MYKHAGKSNIETLRVEAKRGEREGQISSARNQGQNYNCKDEEKEETSVSRRRRRPTLPDPAQSCLCRKAEISNRSPSCIVSSLGEEEDPGRKETKM
eukprot:6527074-Pyramimonas_sp.AAC.1